MEDPTWHRPHGGCGRIQACVRAHKREKVFPYASSLPRSLGLLAVEPSPAEAAARANPWLCPAMIYRAPLFGPLQAGAFSIAVCEGRLGEPERWEMKRLPRIERRSDTQEVPNYPLAMGNDVVQFRALRVCLTYCAVRRCAAGRPQRGDFALRQRAPRRGRGVLRRIHGYRRRIPQCRHSECGYTDIRGCRAHQGGSVYVVISIGGETA